MNKKQPVSRQRVTHGTLAQTLRLLEQGPVTAAFLSATTGVHPVTASRWLRALHKERAVHISGWLLDKMGRDATPMYSLGQRDDLPRRKMTHAEVMRRYRERKRKRQQAQENQMATA